MITTETGEIGTGSTLAREVPVAVSGFSDPAANISVMAVVQHLSQATHDRLSAELAELTGQSRIDIARKIQTAREMGDLSENGDYHAAREEQGKMEARIRQIQATLLDAEIVDAVASDTVVPGVIVSIRYEGDDEAETFLIGSIEERGGEFEVLTPGSPLGESLMGKQVGDLCDFEAPGGVLKVEIVNIES
jgi:transcription elongation factor GreA